MASVTGSSFPRRGAGDKCRRGAAGRQRGSFGSLLLVDVVRVGFALFLLHLFVINFSLVRGSSMLPNIHDGDRLLVDKLCYNIGDVGRFDVVILACPKNPEVDYVKRVVGLPGDQIEIQDGRIRINGVPLEEPFAHFMDTCCDGTWQVPPGGYFVLGDNRPVSSDSREGWCVQRDAIRGRVRACLWPLDRLRTY